MKEIKVGVIGCGYWGPNLIRNFNDNYLTDVQYACDVNKDRLERIKVRYPHINTTTNYKELLKSGSIHAIAIATPVLTHYKLVMEALEADKHVFVEKPLAGSVREAEKLVNFASKKGLILLVDHTFIYTGAMKRIKEFVSSGDIGDMYYFDSVRINLGLFQNDTNVIWDLAPHDFSIMDFLLNEQPLSVSASGASHTAGGMEDMAYITVRFSGSMMAHFHVNWMSPVKIRRIIVGGNKKMLLYDDMDPAEKIKIYDKGVELSKANRKSVYRSLIQYRIGDMFAPVVDSSEALQVEVAHFANCIRNNAKPLTDGESGLRIVRLLEAADKSLKKDGGKVLI
ncbi:MAG: Gfo/Idh/MocA family oxidoreductase [Thermodesulfovibrionales bacterium]